MADITPVLNAADEVTTLGSGILLDLNGLLGNVPGLLGSIPAQVGGLTENLDLGDLLPVNVLGTDVLDGALGGVLETVGDLDEVLTGVLELVPDVLGGVLTGLGTHLDGTTDLLLDQTVGVVDNAVGAVGTVGATVTDLGVTVSSVTDELPARLSALAGIAIVGTDSVIGNLSEIIDVGLGLVPNLLGSTLGSTLGSVEPVLTDVPGTLEPALGSLDLGSLLAAVPATVSTSADEVGTAAGGIAGEELSDVDSAVTGTPSVNNLVIAAQSVVTAVPADPTTFAADALPADPTGLINSLLGDEGGITGLDHVVEAVTGLVQLDAVGLEGLGLGGLDGLDGLGLDGLLPVGDETVAELDLDLGRDLD